MKTIILDFDGTIADTKKIIIEIFTKTLKKLGYPVADEHSIQNTIGLPLREMFVKVVDIKDEAEIEKAIATYREIFGDADKHEVALFPHVGDTLHTLYDNGFILAAASSRSHNSLEEMFCKLGISSYVSYVFGVEDVVNKKPAPEMVLKILEATKTSAQDALVVGDTIYDIQMGQEAGCKTCGVTYGNHTAEQLHNQNADYVIDDFSKILHIVKCPAHS